MHITQSDSLNEWFTIYVEDSVDFEGDLKIEVSDDQEGNDLTFYLNEDGRRQLRSVLDKVDGVKVGKAAEFLGGFNEASITLAIEHDREISFQYQKKSGPGGVIERRNLAPSNLFETKGHKIVVGFDPDRDGPRAYRLDRILGSVTVSG